MKDIFLNGKPLEVVVDLEEKKEISSDAETTTKEIKKSIYKPVSIKPSSGWLGHEKASILTDDEIRQEYGVDAKPFDRLIDKIVFLMLQRKRSMRNYEIMSVLNLRPKQAGLVASAMTRAHEKVPHILSRSQDMRWHLNGVSTVAEFKEKYDAELFKTKKKTKKVIKPEIVEAENEQKGNELLLKRLFEKVTHDGLKIKIEGSVKIIFSVERGE